MIVCDPSQPVKVSKHFSAKLVVLGVETPITKGFACVLHHGGVTEAASLKKLVAQLSKGTGEIVKRKPRILAKNSSAQVRRKAYLHKLQADLFLISITPHILTYLRSHFSG